MSFEIFSVKVLTEKALSDMRQKRLDLGLSQQALAEFLDVSVGTVRRWENTDCVPSLKNMRSIRVFINSSPDDIYKFLNV